MWVGAHYGQVDDHQSVKPNWYWVDGTPTTDAFFQNDLWGSWAGTTYPTNYEGYDCAAWYDNNSLYNKPCTTKYNFVC